MDCLLHNDWELGSYRHLSPRNGVHAKGVGDDATPPFMDAIFYKKNKSRLQVPKS